MLPTGCPLQGRLRKIVFVCVVLNQTPAMCTCTDSFNEIEYLPTFLRSLDIFSELNSTQNASYLILGIYTHSPFGREAMDKQASQAKAMHPCVTQAPKPGKSSD